jgi:hypothetical protein
MVDSNLNAFFFVLLFFSPPMISISIQIQDASCAYLGRKFDGELLKKKKIKNPDLLGIA